MNKGIIVIVVLALVGIGAYTIYEQNQETTQVEQIDVQATNQLTAAQDAAKQAKQAALAEAKKLEAEAVAAKQAAIEEAKRLEEAANKQAEELAAKINNWIAEAKAFLNDGNYNEAIGVAKTILAKDAKNQEAKSIIEQAQAKIKEIAQQSTTTVVDESKKALENVKSGVSLP